MKTGEIESKIKRGEKNFLCVNWVKEMHFDFLVPLNSTLGVSDYELKVRPGSMVSCFSLAVFIYVGTRVE